ncbi:MAG: hypothetical protein KDD25_00495 [Bdellovibrionales bacterium]|nr:hypothetical protein [Bdellovibrionales bacterium]
MTSGKEDKLYFFNFWVDFLFIGGLSILVLGVLSLFIGMDRSENVTLFAAAMTWFINDPHFSATNYRLYGNKGNTKQFPITSYVIPVLILLGVVASLANPSEVAPYFVKLFVIWSPYHFSGQSMGITMVYFHRAGLRLSKWERFALSTFIFSSFTSVVLFYESGHSLNTQHFGIPYESFGVPMWSVQVSRAIMSLAAIAFSGLMIRKSFKEKVKIPFIVFLPAITHFVWYVGGFNFRSFDELVPLFHSVQYMFIALTVQLKSVADAKRETRITKSQFLGRSLKWWAINIAGGFLLFRFLPDLAERFPAISQSIGSPIFIAGVFSAAVQLHHFFVDGVIWKLKSTKNQNPLTVHWPDLLESDPPPAQTAGAQS